MKKYMVLLSVLGLAACGGGSGGGAGIGAPSGLAVGESNARLTSMRSNSEYQVAQYVANKLGDDASSVRLSRSAVARSAFTPTTESSGNLNYDRARELVELAEWLVKNDTTEDDIKSKFNTSKDDRNDIKAALKLLDDMNCFVGGSAQETADRIIAHRTDFAEPLADLKAKTEVFNLKNVEVQTAEWSNRMVTLKFNVDRKGRIESIEYPEAQAIIDEARANGDEITDITVGPIGRVGDTNKFVEHAHFDDGTPVDIPYEYVGYGKRLGLQYADFGELKNDLTHVSENWGVQITPFAGGYIGKRVYTVDNAGVPHYDRMRDLADAADDDKITFNGIARGNVTYFWYDGPVLLDDNHYDTPIAEDGLTDNNATLVFDSTGTQTLTADFSDKWYKVQAIKDATGKNAFKIVGGTGGADERFHLPHDENGIVASNMTEGATPGMVDGNSAHNMVYQAGYYGPDGNTGNATEATALMHYQYTPDITHQDANGQNVEYGNVNVTIGFGGTVAQPTTPQP